jgi:plasmid stabilization system protein ParE
MAREVIWSDKALDDLLSIFDYWNTRNKSTSYSKKLNLLFNKIIELITRYPSLGRPTQFNSIKVKIVKEYLIIYEKTPELLFILTIWDSRRNPAELNMHFGL